MVFLLFVRVGLSEFKTQILQHGQHGARRGDAHQPWFMFVQILADGPTIGFLPGGPYDHQNSDRRSFGQMIVKKPYGREKR